MLDITRYEAMVKLNLPQDEREDDIAKRAELVLESFAELDAVDTDGVLPLVSVLDVQNVLREDVAVKFMPRDELLANAVEQYDGYFEVPKTVD